MGDFENTKVRRLRGLSPERSDVERQSQILINIKVKRLASPEMWEARIPRDLIVQIAAEKNVKVLWDEPITFETVKKQGGRGFLKFQALCGAEKVPIYEVLDVDELLSPASSPQDSKKL